MRKLIIALIAFAFTTTSSYAGPKIEVLHWWTSGGEAAALKVLKDDFAANGGEWLDMPVTGGGGVSNEIDFLSEVESMVKKFVIGKEYQGVFLKPKFGDASGVRGAARLGRVVSN